jgi:hypothetical protein
MIARVQDSLMASRAGLFHYPPIKKRFQPYPVSGPGFVAIGNETATEDRSPSIAVDFESSAAFLKAGTVYFR